MLRLCMRFLTTALALSLLLACHKASDERVPDDYGGGMVAPDAGARVPDDFTGMQPIDAAAAMPSATPETAATALATATTSDTAPAASASAVVTNCGSKQNPCPLQKWMKQHTQADLSAGDDTAIAADLEKIAAMAPPGYSRWSSISKDGATAARAGNTDAVKASCRGCHDAYKTKYKTEMRGRAVPGA